MSEQCPQTCIGCPALPEGVRATVERVSPIPASHQGYFAYDFAKDEHKAEGFSRDSMLVTFRATDSMNPRVDINDVAQIVVADSEATKQSVETGITDCPGPTLPDWRQRLVGKAAVCNGLPKHIVSHTHEL